MKEINITSNIEEYLEAIYVLTRNGHDSATVKDIAERLNVTPASVTEMIKKLAEKGYVLSSPYHGATLTASGLKIGSRMSRKHRLLERFLHDVLKIGRDTVHQQACDMEHSLSDEAEVALCQFLKHPSKCPDDGKPIQPCDLKLSSCEECLQHRGEGVEQVGRRDKNLVSISDLKEHASGRVVFVRGEQKKLRRLLDMGLTPNTMVKVVRSAPLGGPIEIEVRGSKVALGRGIAADVFVEMVKEGKLHG